jgi:phosphoribosyl 1,2-cyclic phosphodiesterase
MAKHPGSNELDELGAFPNLWGPGQAAGSDRLAQPLKPALEAVVKTHRHIDRLIGDPAAEMKRPVESYRSVAQTIERVRAYDRRLAMRELKA